MAIWAPLETIAETIHRRVCPLYTQDDARRIRLIGSGVPFQSGPLTFIVTAAHVFGNNDGSALPLFTVGADLPFALTGKRVAYEHIRNVTLDPDIGLIGVTPDAAARLGAYYQLSAPADTSRVVAAAPDTAYILAGYPETRNRVLMSRQVALTTTPTYIITPRLLDAVPERKTGKHAKYHFALSAERKRARNFRGGRVGMPKFSGMSGGGVWKVHIGNRGELASTPILVGVIIEHLRNEQVFVAARIHSAIPLAYELLEHERQS
jgi:hypothetical protein